MKTALNSSPSLVAADVSPLNLPHLRCADSNPESVRADSRRLLRAIGLALLLGALPTARAATITVANLDDSGPGSLRQAIADAAPGDTIDFTVTGTITLTSGELAIGKDLTIAGPGVTNLTIDGNQASRVLLVTNGTVFVSSLTVSNGYAPGSGGGIANSTTLTLSNCCITACSAYSVGPSTGAGGVDNGDDLTIIDSTISKNGGTYWAGGILNGGLGTLKLVRSAVTQNSGIVSGGVLNGGMVSATNSTFSLNSRSGILNGGAYFGGVSTMLWLQSSTVCSNYSTYYGGGYGIINNGSSDQCHLANSTVVGNGYAELAGESFISDDYNLIQTTNGATITGVTTHNIYGKDPLLGPLTDNGGPTPTHALLPGSPAIDHGSSGGLATDQRGLPRPFNFPAYFNADDGSDIGAYELQERAQTGPGFTVNTTDDAEDGVPGIAHCSLREAIAAANANADTNTIDFAVAIPGLHTGVTGTILLTNVVTPNYGTLRITNSLAIVGPGASNLSISGNNAYRVFQIEAGNVAISGLKITNGKLPSAFGPPESFVIGAGILNYTDLRLANCVISENTNDFYGAIYNSGTMAISECIISTNRSGGTAGAVFNLDGMLSINGSVLSGNFSSSSGGGIANTGGLAITNTTISGNTGYEGGGIMNSRSSQVGNATLQSCTIFGNTAFTGGGIYNLYAVSVHNSLVAGNSAVGSGQDFNGTVNSLDYNLIQNTNGCTITNLTAHNLYNLDPKLGPLADLGGPTPTHALRFDSPALDAGHSGGLTTDQRGLPRPIDSPDIANADGGDGSDIGAYEADPNFRIMAIEKIGSDIRLRFNTMLGRNYRLDSEDNLNNSWTVLTNDIIGAGSSVQAVDSGAATLPRRFYRGVMLLP